VPRGDVLVLPAVEPVVLPLVPLVAVPLVVPLVVEPVIEPALAPVDIFALVRMNDPPATDRDPDAAVSVGVAPVVALPEVPVAPCAESPDCRQPTTVTWP
jgi:hypothetical protein